MEERTVVTQKKKQFGNKLRKVYFTAHNPASSSLLAKGSADKNVISLLISKSETLGRNTLRDERCICNTRSPCVMTDV